MPHKIIVGQAECGGGQRGLAKEPGVGLPGNAEQGKQDSIEKEIRILHLYQSSLCPFPDFPDFANCSLTQSKEYSVAYKSKASVTYIEVIKLDPLPSRQGDRRDMVTLAQRPNQ
jgi:hypothetical protein